MGARRDRVHAARGRDLVLGLARDLRQAAGADDDASRSSSPGCPLLMGGGPRWRPSRRPSPSSSRARAGSPSCCSCSASLTGVLLVLPVGGADVPIVISLLNAFTGLAVAASGLVLGNVLLVVAGTLVGASGTILTRAMASAMGRSVSGIMFGAFRGGSTAGSTEASDRPGALVEPRRRRRAARLRAEGRSSCRATASPSRRASTPWPSCSRSSSRGASRWSSPSTPWPVACPGT